MTTTAPVRSLGRSIPVFPVLTAAAVVMSIFAESTAALPALWRPLAVAAIATALVQLVLTGVVRDRHLGALFALIVVLGTFGYMELVLAAAGIVTVGAVIGIRSRRPLRAMPWRQLTAALNLITVIVVVLGALSVRDGLSSGLPAGLSQRTGSTAEPAPADAPDIYVLLLDGYPRSDTLETEFGFDNEPFLQEMADQGFETSRDSRSNYNLTSLTLASMFNMAPVADLVPDPPSQAWRQYRVLAEAINTGSALDELRQRGYEIVTVPSPFSLVTLYDADRLIDDGGVTEFELSLLGLGVIRFVLPDLQHDFFIESHRERVRSAFRSLRELAGEASERPRFVFLHVMTPHPPYVFGPNGEPREGPACFPVECDLWNGTYQYADDLSAELRDQVTYLNREVAQTTRDVIAASEREAVVVVMSDHGHRRDLDDRVEMLRSFFIARTPSHPALFPDDSTPINVMPRLLNAYFDAGLDLAEEGSYWVDLRTIGTAGMFDPVAIPDVR